MSVPSQYAGKTTVRVRVHGSMQYEHWSSLCEFRMVAEDDRDSKENWLSGKVAPTEQIDFKVKPQIYKAYFRACDDDWKASVTVDASESTEIVVMFKPDGGTKPKWTLNYVPPGLEASAFAWAKVIPHAQREVAAPTSTESSGGGEEPSGEAPAETDDTPAPAEEQACTPDGQEPPQSRERYCCSKKTYPKADGGAFVGYICCSSGPECH
jgi:hypothetical protein